MRSIILAAGASRRLYPLTKNLPKCLLRVGKKKIIDYQIQPLLENNIKKITIVVGFHKEKIISYLTSTYPEAKFNFIYNPIFDKTNSIYSLWLAKKDLKEDFMYFNSDVLCHPEIISKLAQGKKKNLVVFQRVQCGEEEGKLIMDKNLLIKNMGKGIDPELSSEYIGIAKFGGLFKKHLVQTLEEVIKNKQYQFFTVDLFGKVIRNYPSKVFGLDVDNLPAIEIDFPEDLKRAREFIAPEIDNKS